MDAEEALVTHIDPQRMKTAAEKKLKLSADEWRHLEECRVCFEMLSAAIRDIETSTARD